MGLEIGGAETHVAELAIELSRRGHEICVASNGGVYEEEIKKHGIKHFKLPLHTKRPLSMLKSYFGLKKIIKGGNFDIVHAHARIPAFICSRLHKKLKFRFITSAHWVFKTNFLLKRITDWGERSVAVSNDIKKYLIDSYGFKADRIDVTINGIDTSKFSSETDFSDIKDEFGLGVGKFRIVYVSRMDTDRSAVAFNLINIAPRLFEKYENLEIVIVGGGNDYQRLEKKAAEANAAIGKRVIITTGARTDINKFVASGDMFIGVSRAALEAMSAEKPVIIAGNEGYIGVFGEDKIDISIKTNFCCRGCEMPNDEKLFSDVCSIAESSERQKTAEFNRNFILENYSVDRMANDYEKSYKKLLEKNPFRPNDVLISGYYGFDNTGDDSLLKAIISNLKAQKSDISITVLSVNPKETSEIYGVESIHRYNIVRINSLLKRTRLLISGGGSLLQDVTSTKSYRYYSSIIKAALKHGAKVMVYANGIGPLRNRRNRADCARLLSNVDAITLRDANSYQELVGMGVKKEISVTADPAFSLECDEKAKAYDSPYFIVSLRRWKHLPKNFTEIMAYTCRKISEKYGYKPVFMPMQSKIDRDICSLVAGSCGGVVIEHTHSIEELLGYIKNSRFVLGMRLHSLIYALSMGVPVIALSYDPKIDAIVDKWSCCTAFDARYVRADDILKQVDITERYRDEICSEIKETTDSMREKTYHDSETAVRIMEF